MNFIPVLPTLTTPGDEAGNVVPLPDEETFKARNCANCLLYSVNLGCTAGRNPALPMQSISRAEQLMGKAPEYDVALLCDSFSWGPVLFHRQRIYIKRALDTNVRNFGPGYDGLDPKFLMPKFFQYISTDRRIAIVSDWGLKRHLEREVPGEITKKDIAKLRKARAIGYGTVAVTTGVTPVMLLMRRHSNRSSSHILRSDDWILAAGDPRAAEYRPSNIKPLYTWANYPI
jgi:hypothetical protein